MEGGNQPRSQAHRSEPSGAEWSRVEPSGAERSRELIPQFSPCTTHSEETPSPLSRHQERLLPINHPTIHQPPATTIMPMIASVELLVNALAMLLSSMACLVNALAALISSVACLVNALAALICSVALLVEALARMPGDIMAIIADLKAQAEAEAASACATQKTHTYLLLPPSEESTKKPDDPAALDASAMTAATTTTTSESPKRRCVVVMSTYAHIRMEAVAAKRWIIDGLKNLGVRVTELELDAVEHHVLFKKYRLLSNSTQYPLVFLEDEKTGRNRTFLDHSRIEQHIHNIGMTELQLDEAHVPDAHRPGHVYRDAVKFKHAIIQPPNPHWDVRMEGRFEERERANDRADQVAEAAEAALMAMEDHSA